MLLHASINIYNNKHCSKYILQAFDTYGKAAIKQMKIHPDTFMQIAIQVAGYRTKGRCVYTNCWIITAVFHRINHQGSKKIHVPSKFKVQSHV